MWIYYSNIRSGVKSNCDLLLKCSDDDGIVLEFESFIKSVRVMEKLLELYILLNYCYKYPPQPIDTNKVTAWKEIIKICAKLII